MQIRPHFLFNSFNALNAFIITKQEEKAEFMLSKLSELLRRTIDTSVHEFITVREEVNHLDLYMDIQRLRFGQRMVYHALIDEDTEQALIPFFILQPVVENAIQYSIEISDQPIDLDIRVYKEQSQLILEVRNTFCALPMNDRQGHGIGLSNVRDRLFRHYGETAHLDLKINQDGVTLVKINLPYASS
jgi:LytS/YehU family sensor histidine kinase